MTTPAPQDGLSTPAEVEQLADQITRCADALHERIERDIQAGKLGLDPARTLFDDEVLLRERANGLYADAASLAVRGLGASQATLLHLTTDAEEKIRKVDLIGDAVSLASSVLGLAGAALTGKPQAIIRAVEGIHHAFQSIGKHRKP